MMGSFLCLFPSLMTDSTPLSAVSNRYVIILAGGSGTRFWPLSRNDKPKQLLSLFDNETLLEKALRRVVGIVPLDHILVLTNPSQVAGIRAALPDFPVDNILAEPERRDTAPAIALGMGWVAARNATAAVAVLPADQLVQDQTLFQTVLEECFQLAEASDALVTLGIKPTWACPGYGYIERGERAYVNGYSGRAAVFHVTCFREKPAPELAEEFLSKGNYSWNAGIFIWTMAAFLQETGAHAPELADLVHELRRAGDFNAVMQNQYGHTIRNSIDYALLEKSERVLNVEAGFDWDDVGGWISVGKYLEKDEAGNMVRGALTQLDSEDNLVYSTTGTRIALLGVRDLIVVQTPDALLIADRGDADRIKKLIEIIPPELL